MIVPIEAVPLRGRIQLPNLTDARNLPFPERRPPSRLFRVDALALRRLTDGPCNLVADRLVPHCIRYIFCAGLSRKFRRISGKVQSLLPYLGATLVVAAPVLSTFGLDRSIWHLTTMTRLRARGCSRAGHGTRRRGARLQRQPARRRGPVAPRFAGGSDCLWAGRRARAHARLLTGPASRSQRNGSALPNLRDRTTPF